MVPINIRPATESDLDSLCNLYFEFHEFHARHLPAYLQSLGELTEKERTKLGQEIMKILKDSNSTILVAEETAQIIGFAEIHLKYPDMNERANTPTPYTHLQSLTVTKSCQRKGVGTLLLKTAEAWSQAHGALELRLDIWEFSDGPLGFYQKSGYRTCRRSLVKNI